MEAALQALRQEMDPARVRWEAPAGGYLLWLELSTDAGHEELDALFRRHGVRVLEGSRFFAGDPHCKALRLSISGLDEPEIREGIRRLGAAIRTLPLPSGADR